MERVKSGMRKLLIVDICFCIPLFLFAQSGLNQDKNATQPTVKEIKNHIEAAQQHLANQPEKSLEHINHAISLSRQISDSHHESLALTALAEYNFRLSNYAVAVEKAMEALIKASENNDTLALAKSHRVLGLIYTLGFKQYDKALEHQLKAFELFKTLHDPTSIAAFCGNITWIYAITGEKLNEAHRLADRGLQLSDSLHNNQLLSYNHNSKGLLYKAQQRFDSALHHFEKSNQAARAAQDLAVLAYNRELMGEVALQKGNIRQALEWLNEAAALSSKLKLREVLKDSYKSMAQAHLSMGDFKRAYQHFVRFTELKDSLLNWETTQRAILVNRQAEEERQKKQLAALEQSARQAQREQLIISVFFAIVFILMSMVLMLVLRNNRFRKLTNEALEEKNRQIEEQNKQLLESSALRDRLFSIISHDLRSPLVSLRGLLGLLQKSQITEEEFKMFAPKINQLLTGMNETLENLLSWGQSQLGIMSFQPVRLQPHDLVNKVFGLFADMARSKNIALINKIDLISEINYDKNLLELILRNLIHNGIKFSHSGGEVIVRARALNSDYVLEVADKGIGMNARQKEEVLSGTGGSSRGTQGEKGTGLGLRLCNELLVRCGGYLEIESEEGQGSVFRVVLEDALAVSNFSKEAG